MRKVLIIGRGTLGSSFEGVEWIKSCTVEYAGRRSSELQHTLDISHADQVMRFFENHSGYHLIVNCAAMSGVDDCERQPDLAHQINGVGVKHLAEASARHHIPLIHVSTDYVFSGQNKTPYVESDVPGPCSVYGTTKLEGEAYALGGAPVVAVVRPSWIFGEMQDRFVPYFRERLVRGEPIRVIDDQVSCPTYAVDLAEAIGRIARDVLWSAQARGDSRREIFHVTNEGPCTRHEMVLAMKEILGKRSDVHAIASTDLTQWVAIRPRHSVLSKDKYHQAFGIRLRPWRKALEAFLSHDSHAPVRGRS